MTEKERREKQLASSLKQSADKQSKATKQQNQTVKGKNYRITCLKQR